MSMEISSNYGNYYAGMAADTKKESGRVSEDTKNAKGSSKDNVQEYYEKLCRKFPQISFNTNGGEMRCGSNKVVVNLSYDCLKKMANDPEFAKKIEWNLSGEVAANNMVYSNAKRDGVELGGRTVTYDGNGNRQSSCGGMRTANTGNNSNRVRNRLEEQNEKIKKKREERKIAEENSKTHSSARQYRQYLSDKYECLKSKEYSVSINSALLSKAMRDKKISDWLEYNLSIMPQAYEKMKAAVEARGSKILSCKTEITGYDSMETQMVTRAEVDTGVEKARKELKERIEERQKEKKAMEERAAKRRAEKEQEEERIAKAKTGEARISATGNSVESVTKSVISAISANVEAGVAGFDVKA